jgi:pyridoxine kinase
LSILSIQSHVAYGYAGNKAAVFPLQSMGHEVWPIHTVQFSNHTGYGASKGDIFSAEHIRQVIEGVMARGVAEECRAVLSGYLGSAEIGETIREAVATLRAANPDLLYLCDPVMGDVGRGMFVKEEVVRFYQTSLHADIITPNHFEAEFLYGKPITTLQQAKEAAAHMHQMGIAIVIITSLQIQELPEDTMHVFLSDRGKCWLGETPYFTFSSALKGTGDLFSALFLGYYLHSRQSELALQHTLASICAVIEQTHKLGKHELAILHPDYKQPLRGVVGEGIRVVTV